MQVPLHNIYYLLAYAVGALSTTDHRLDRGHTQADTPLDLLHDMLCSYTERVLVRSLERNYVERQDDLRRLRGRPDISATVGRALRQRGRVRCLYDEFTANTVANRILRTTLERLMRTPTLNMKRRTQARRLAERFQGITPIALGSGCFQKVQFHRNNLMYRIPLGVAELLHFTLLPTETEGRFRFEDFTRNEQRMGYLFEKFVRNFIKREMGRFQVSKSHPNWLTDASPASLGVIPRLETDIVLNAHGGRVVIECKFTKCPLRRNRSGNLKLDRSHLSQLMTYMMAMENENRPPRYGMLLYAQVDNPMRYDMVLGGYEIAVRSLNLAQPWPALRDALMRLGDEVEKRLSRPNEGANP